MDQPSGQSFRHLPTEEDAECRGGSLTLSEMTHFHPTSTPYGAFAVEDDLSGCRRGPPCGGHPGPPGPVFVRANQAQVDQLTECPTTGATTLVNHHGSLRLAKHLGAFLNCHWLLDQPQQKPSGIRVQ
jgi:hypothetical protein